MGAIGAEYQIQYDAANKSLDGNVGSNTDYFVISAADIAVTNGFNFDVRATVGPNPSGASIYDDVPETDTNFPYTMQNKVKAAVTLSISDWQSNTARAGKPFVTGVAVKRSDTGGLMSGAGTISCTLSVAGKTVAPYGHAFLKVPWYSGGSKVAALCDWHIPPGTVGATAIAKETVTLGTSTVSKTFVYHVRK